MNSFVLRFHALRLQAPIAMLILLLQRSPALQWLLAAEGPAPSVIVNLLRSALVVTSAAAVTHTLTGATTFTANPPSPEAATVGQSFSMTFKVTGAPTPAVSYEIVGTLPPGLSIPGMNASGILNATTGTISGTPTTAGNYSITIQAWDATNASGETNNVGYPVNFSVSGGTTAAPTITTQPASSTVTVGSTASFTVAATGTPGPTYQWRKGATAITGATAATLTLTNVQSTDAGTYSVVVTNSAGSVTSANATLTVNPAIAAPTITTQPTSSTVTVGSTASFTVAATGTPAPTYQWRKGTTAITGATAATLTLTNVQSADAGTYSVVVTNSAGSVTSANATLTVTTSATAPTISTQPTSSTVTVGSTASFTVAATGTPAPTYQWRKGTTAITGATAATLTLTNVQSADAGTYSVVVTNSAGSVTSANATLTVNAVTPPGTAPTITTQPANLMLPAGYGGTLTIAATGTAPLTYQWRLNGVAIPGATGSSLALTNVQTAASGNYSVVVSNASGSVTSTIATVTVGTATGRFLNLSTRGYVGTGNNVLIAGLVVSGSSPKSILIRAVGPALVPMGLSPSEVLADPVLVLKDSTGADLATNDNWGDAPSAAILSQVFHSVGAFDLTAGSTDSVLLVTLPPGIYTALATGKNGGTGIALLETYEVP